MEERIQQVFWHSRRQVLLLVVQEHVLDLELEDEGSQLQRPELVFDYLVEACSEGCKDLLCLSDARKDGVDFSLALGKVKIGELMVPEPVDLLQNVEVALDCSLADGELGRELSNLIKVELPGHLLCHLGHSLEVVEFAQVLDDLGDVEAVVEGVL